MQNKSRKNKIAIIGATGNVGRKIVEILAQRNFLNPIYLRLFSSKRSAGQRLDIENYSYGIEDVADYDFQDCYLALFATDSDISKMYVPKALEAGAKVVDSSSAYRLDPNVPLIVPPVNGDLITMQHNLFSVANCLACPISVVLKPLNNYAIIHRVLVSTYQSTSGAGKGAMDELYQQTKSMYTGEPYQSKYFDKPIAFNVIPQVDKILKDGFSYEEIKITKEVQKIISANLKIVSTAVRVPVMIGHSISLSIEFSKKIDLDDIRMLLSKSPGVQLSLNDYTTPAEVVGKDDVFVGRFRKDPTVDHGLLLWLTSDNLRRVAALDAVEISETVTRVMDKQP